MVICPDTPSMSAWLVKPLAPPCSVGILRGPIIQCLWARANCFTLCAMGHQDESKMRPGFPAQRERERERCMPWLGHSCTAVDSIPTRSGGRGTRPPVGEKRHRAAMPPGVLAWTLVCPSSWTLFCPSSWTLVCPLSTLVPLFIRGFELDLAFPPCIFQHFRHDGGKFYPAKGRVCTPIRPIKVMAAESQ